ncbi:unnamed protein product, partial [marine sediment metagenome]
DAKFHNSPLWLGRIWRVDGNLVALSGAVNSHIGESQLQRIDDGRELSSWDALEGIFNPLVTVKE